MPQLEDGPHCTRCGECEHLSLLTFTPGRVESMALQASGAPALEYDVPPRVAYLCNACGHQGGVNVGKNWRPE